METIKKPATPNAAISKVMAFLGLQTEFQGEYPVDSANMVGKDLILMLAEHKLKGEIFSEELNTMLSPLEVLPQLSEDQLVRAGLACHFTRDCGEYGQEGEEIDWDVFGILNRITEFWVPGETELDRALGRVQEQELQLFWEGLSENLGRVYDLAHQPQRRISEELHLHLALAPVALRSLIRMPGGPLGYCEYGSIHNLYTSGEPGSMPGREGISSRAWTRERFDRDSPMAEASMDANGHDVVVRWRTTIRHRGVETKLENQLHHGLDGKLGIGDLADLLRHREDPQRWFSQLHQGSLLRWHGSGWCSGPERLVTLENAFDRTVEVRSVTSGRTFTIRPQDLCLLTLSEHWQIEEEEQDMPF